MSNQGPFVCTECIEDTGISEFIENKKTKGDCSFCYARGTPVALLDEVAQHMKICLYVEYDDANDWLITDEGDYNIPWWDTWDLLADQRQLDLPLALTTFAG